MNENSDSSHIDILPSRSRGVLVGQIERLNISADAKALLSDIVDKTVEVGGRIIAVGREILTFIFDLTQRFPNTAFGVIVSLVVSSLIAAIPLLGAILGPLLAPLILAFGLSAGALADMKEAAIRSRIQKLEQDFATAMNAA